MVWFACDNSSNILSRKLSGVMRSFNKENVSVPHIESSTAFCLFVSVILLASKWYESLSALVIQSPCVGKNSLIRLYESIPNAPRVSSQWMFCPKRDGSHKQKRFPHWNKRKKCLPMKFHLIFV